MLVGIMGGTFDPIHTGHLIAAERARVEGGLDEVWLMPANVPPHKPNAPKGTSQQRWEMVCLAAEGNPFFVLSISKLTKAAYHIVSIRSSC